MSSFAFSVKSDVGKEVIMKLLEKIKSCCKRPKKEVQTNQPKPAVEATAEKPPEVPKKGEGA
jgi:hypothetical protein